MVMLVDHNDWLFHFLINAQLAMRTAMTIGLSEESTRQMSPYDSYQNRLRLTWQSVSQLYASSSCESSDLLFSETTLMIIEKCRGNLDNPGIALSVQRNSGHFLQTLCPLPKVFCQFRFVVSPRKLRVARWQVSSSPLSLHQQHQ